MFKEKARLAGSDLDLAYTNIVVTPEATFAILESDFTTDKDALDMERRLLKKEKGATRVEFYREVRTTVDEEEHSVLVWHAAWDHGKTDKLPPPFYVAQEETTLSTKRSEEILLLGESI